MHYSAYTSHQPDPRKRQRLAWWIVGFSFFALIGWFAIGPILALRKIQDSTGNQPSSSLLGFLGKIVSDAPLKGESDQRINILALGVGGQNHLGGQLADTIQLISIVPKNKQVAIMSLPRDLNVCQGLATTKSLRLTTCKINEIHAYGEQNSAKTGGGPKLMKNVAGEIIGLPVHYYVRIDFEGFVRLVDALGGIEIDVERAIYDPLYPAPDMIRYEPFRLPAGRQSLDGKTALKYVRSRHGTSQNDFERSRRQQQVGQIIKDKVLSLNILANPKRIKEIANVLGTHVRTDLATWEIARLAEIAARDAQDYTFITRVLSVGTGEPLVSVNEGGYYLVPRAGNFRGIQMIAANLFNEPQIKKEAAKVEVINASGKPALLTEVVAGLKNLGYAVVGSRSAASTVAATTLYDYSAGAKPNTAKLLGEFITVKATTQVRPDDSTADFALVIGTDYKGE